jgi:hypothetical protein
MNAGGDQLSSTTEGGSMNHFVSALALAAAASASHATTVLPTGALIDLGTFSAGTYSLVGTGLVDLCGGGTFVMRPDGIPNSTVTCSNYGATFNPNGSFIADSTFARAGTNAKIGALIGTLNASAFTGLNPTVAQASDWFLIGFSATVTLNTAGHIYASVNDTAYSNNTGAFQVTVSQVPESSTYALMAIGLAALSAMSRRSAA